MPHLLWNQIDTVLLDMDGTLLDLHFDNHFWLEHVPAKLAARQGISLQQAKAMMQSEYEKVHGTLSWYCLDYWAEKLDMDIMQAKREIQHLIDMRDDTLPFLDALHDSGREVVLVTNAHPGSLSLKVERTQLDSHIDRLISTHQFGVTKESQSLWQQLQAMLGFDPMRTLFVDDSLTILHAAETFGIKHLLAVANPDSQQAVRSIDGFPAVTDYRTLLDDIRANPVLRS
ncbi:GMP/IMP nucleotidase [Aestuariibacter halophilus]|uniref:GMP/IMP nucleotidase n=1 Tax=Fluctibacter halophilus TaxID=226011 RepID=A0ABS8G8Y5_9ALTE|nr:GMP/IMP nucleotidase [Aestuariibacter halophilus]MCC2617042.1 GMP/IMP nucleotidase [Aestuariibacter halophilus]